MLAELVAKPTTELNLKSTFLDLEDGRKAELDGVRGKGGGCVEVNVSGGLAPGRVAQGKQGRTPAPAQGPKAQAGFPPV